MARGAVALVLAVEQRETAQLGRREFRVAFQKPVVLRIERMQLGRELLVHRDREARAQQRAVGIVERIVAEQLHEIVGAGGRAQLGSDG